MPSSDFRDGDDSSGCGVLLDDLPGPLVIWAGKQDRMETKKLINHATNIVDEMIEGLLAAHPRHLRRAEGRSGRMLGRR